MDKKILIKPTTSFFKSYRRCLLIDTNHNEGVPLLTFKILVKEISNPLNISFISPSEEYFNEIFPNLKGNIKTATKYSLGNHTLSFLKYDKTLIKNSAQEYDTMVFYPAEEMKEKEIFKIAEKNKSLRKFVIISHNMIEPSKVAKKYDPDFISLRSSDDTIYYSAMKQKISDIK